MKQMGFSAAVAEAAVSQGRQQVADGRGTRLVACHWLSDGQIILVDAEVSRVGQEAGGTRIEEVTAEVVLELRPELPAGGLHREMTPEQVLAMAAESFGIPLTGDPDEPISTLYSGPGNEQDVVVHSGCIPPMYWLIGSFDPRQSYCELVWAFRPDRYQTWWEISRR